MLDLLLRASVEGAVVVAAIWIVVRLVPLSPSLRAVLWWCAAAKFAISLLWIAPLEIPVLRPPSTDTAALRLNAERASDGGGSAFAAGPPAPFAEPARGGWVDPSDTLALAWYAGVAVALLLMARRWRRTAGIVRRAAPAPRSVQDAVARLAGQLALARVPEPRVSSEVRTPLVAGPIRPIVLLPDRFAELAPLQQRMALCHELAHVRRGDLWIGWIPALAERLFFFHPLARLAAREYAFWREASCDADVLDTLGVSPREYGSLLLDLGIAPPRASVAAAGASWSFSNLKRRIHMLGDPTHASRSRTSRLAAAAAVLLAAAAVVPMRLVARAPVADAVLDQAPSAIAEPLPAVAQEPRPPATATPSTPAAPAVPAAPATPATPAVRDRQRQEREPRYVVLAGEGDDRAQVSGSHEDIERAKSFRKGNEPLLWFKDARGEFVVRDPSIVGEVEKIWSPVGDLGAQQGRLGAQQGALGARMGELGAKQGAIGAEHGRIGARHAEIGLRHAKLAMAEVDASDAQRAELEKARQELDREMRAIDKEMKTLDARMREFEKPMRDLSAEMEALGREMEKRGKELEQAAKRAEAEMQQLFDRAIASGAAQKVK